jgi:hypothetical protein
MNAITLAETPSAASVSLSAVGSPIGEYFSTGAQLYPR